ncbi:MAG: choline/carnitine O-acyltransferase, partial [Defluviitaleaceae bacterium]|nr:choline/carnitine O-acyltransferase [Defluviitaleaceae bacterium]
GYVFAGCRLPMAGQDGLYVGAGSVKNAHVLVMSRGNMYVLPVTDADGEMYGVAGLSAAIAQIDSADEPSPNIGILTTAKRDEAAKLYGHLQQLDPRNAENFEKVNSALFALCIDHRGSRSADAAIFDMLYGYGQNRWFDKCFQIILADDYSVGFNNEHTAYDAAVWTSILQGVYKELAGEGGGEGSGSAPGVTRLEWTVDAEASQAISKMEQADKTRGTGILLNTHVFDGFGSGAMKELKSSPDAFFHLALQLAWFRHTGRLDSTYEAVSMRQYHQGRTECMRPSTTAVLDFMLAHREGLGRADLEKLARKAFDMHVGMIMQCQAGNGPERHLTGLETMAAAHGISLDASENIFAGKAYARLKHDTISSSGLSVKGLEFFAFGAVVDDGFGVGYVIDADNIRLCLSCTEQNKDALVPFTKEVGRALFDIRDILRGEG